MQRHRLAPILRRQKIDWIEKLPGSPTAWWSGLVAARSRLTLQMPRSSSYSHSSRLSVRPPRWHEVLPAGYSAHNHWGQAKRRGSRYACKPASEVSRAAGTKHLTAVEMEH